MRHSGKIDLHMHTTVSDGTDTPAEILERMRREGMTLFSVTDHDAVKGGQEICGLLQPGDPAFLTGVEFSCRDEEGKYHILGYGYDPLAPAIQRLVDTSHGYRMAKLAQRLEGLRDQFDLVFPEEAIESLYAMDNPGKPHIGNLMARYGFAKSKDAAIEDYLNRIPARSSYLRPEEAIRGILASGGIPVLAHPSFGDGGQRITGTKMERRLRRLMDMGLAGVEAFYSGFGRDLTSEMLSFAERFDLYVTAGSDYHGNNKSVLPGDTGFAAGEAYPEGLQRFLRDIEPQIYRPDRGSKNGPVRRI